MGNTRYQMKEPSMKEYNSKLIYLTKSKFEGDWCCTLHTHYFTEIFYVTSGAGVLVVEGNEFSVKEHDLIIINPNIEHTEKSYFSKPLEYIVLGIEGLAFDFKKAEMSAHYWINNYKDKGKEIHMFLTMLLAEIEEQKPEYEFVCQKLLQVLLVQVMRDTDSNIITTDKFMHKKINKECSRVKRYLDSNYSDHITLDLLANITHMNKYYLIHAFTKYTGMSPINYLKSKRLEESKTLLETTDMTVAGICNNVGFSSQAYFSQAFKKHTGISPNEYRKKIKSSDGMEI